MEKAIPCWVFKCVAEGDDESEYCVYILDTEKDDPPTLKTPWIVFRSPVASSLNLAKVASDFRDWVRKQETGLGLVIKYDAPRDDHILSLGSGKLSIYASHRDLDLGAHKLRNLPLNGKEIAEFRRILQST